MHQEQSHDRTVPTQTLPLLPDFPPGHFTSTPCARRVCGGAPCSCGPAARLLSLKRKLSHLHLLIQPLIPPRRPPTAAAPAPLTSSPNIQPCWARSGSHLSADTQRELVGTFSFCRAAGDYLSTASLLPSSLDRKSWVSCSFPSSC